MRIISFIFILIFSMLMTGCVKDIPVNINTIPSGAMAKEDSLGAKWMSGEVMMLPYKEDGYYNISISKDGYEDILKSFRANPKGINYTFRLKKLYTTLEINMQPYNTLTTVKCGDMSFTGNKVIKIPDSLFADSNRVSCTIEGSSDGYVSLKKSIVIKKYSNTITSDVLKANKVLIYFDTTPSFVDVYESSLGYLGTTPFVYDLKANKMQGISTYTGEGKLDKTRLNLLFKKDGYETQEKSIWLEKNQTEKLNIKMIQSKR